MKNVFIIDGICTIYSNADPKELKQLFYSEGSPYMDYNEIESLVRSFVEDDFIMQPLDVNSHIDLNKLGSKPDEKWIENHEKKGFHL